MSLKYRWAFEPLSEGMKIAGNNERLNSFPEYVFFCSELSAEIDLSIINAWSHLLSRNKLLRSHSLIVKALHEGIFLRNATSKHLAVEYMKN